MGSRVESRADNYNAYHKLAVAVAEVWGSAITWIKWQATERLKIQET